MAEEQFRTFRLIDEYPNFTSPQDHYNRSSVCTVHFDLLSSY
jgi:hypothetical protein